VNRLVGGIFNFTDRLQMASLDHRLKRGEVHTANIANSETPGYRALGYDFEEQLAALAHVDGKTQVKVSDPKHFRNGFTRADGKIEPDIFIRPTESVPEDGNTVDVDEEMVRMSENQILYRSAVEVLNRKIGVLKYAINGGR
jgi:flagellar basal-body rod protein FlgB